MKTRVALQQVVAIHVHEAVLVPDGAGEGKPTVDVDSLRPLGRLGGNTYCRVGSVFDLPRPDRAASAAQPK
jgi:flavin reductase (DIM6/NTAB) family NADH-FMN oxidoreductase RutF